MMLFLLHFVLYLIVSIALLLPAIAQDPKPFKLNAKQTGLYVDPDWSSSDSEDKMLPDKLNPLIDGYTKQQDQIQETALTKVRLPEDISHGEEAVGVLGAYTEDYDGKITKILTGSDLLRLGIVVGDKIKKIDGKPYGQLGDFRTHCRGLPGTTMILTIEHNGKTAPYIVKRADARLFANDEDSYYSWCVKQMKRW